MLKIRELNKPGNTWCPHCKIGAGCTIYDSRPGNFDHHNYHNYDDHNDHNSGAVRMCLSNFLRRYGRRWSR